MSADDDSRPRGEDDTQPDDVTDIGERPTLRWVRIGHAEPAPATLRLGSSTESVRSET